MVIGLVVSGLVPVSYTHLDVYKRQPKTSVGKFDKKVLRARYAEGGLDVTTLG